MAKVVVTLKVMPKGLNVDFDRLEREIEKKLSGEVKKEIENIAFGLRALKFIFVWNEEDGGTDSLENEIKRIKGVKSVEVIDVRRAIG